MCQHVLGAAGLRGREGFGSNGTGVVFVGRVVASRASFVGQGAGFAGGWV